MKLQKVIVAMMLPFICVGLTSCVKPHISEPRFEFPAPPPELMAPVPELNIIETSNPS